MTDASDGEGAETSEVERLRRDLRDAREEIIATNAVLSAMGRSASDLDLVFGAIVDSARRLTHADAAVLSLVDGAHYRLARTSGCRRRTCSTRSTNGCSPHGGPRRRRRAHGDR